MPGDDGTTGTSSLIGVAICVAGNTCVSLALNIQKLAHVHLAALQHQKDDDSSSLSPRRSSLTLSDRSFNSERSPLLLPTAYSHSRPSIDSRLSETAVQSSSGQHVLVPVEVVAGGAVDGTAGNGSQDGSRNRRRLRTRLGRSKMKRPRIDKAFLSEPLWWIGLGLLNIGELGNFVAYAFAPASLVAPLGTVALVANVVFAPLILKEPFRKRDLSGCALAIVGGVVVVWGSRSNDKKLFPDEVLAAISTPLFIAYAAFSVVALVVLAKLSRTRYGDRLVMIDVGICAVAGGFTVLSTKAFSSFINLLFLDTFKYWITYPILATLLATALVQVNYINKSLQRFESRVVIPSQFCSFSLSAIIGSAVLYREFDGVDFKQFMNFLFGCTLSALGVYVLTRESTPPPTSAGTADDHPDRIPSTTPLRHRVSSQHLERPPSLRARTISVTLGGGQYLLAHSPGASMSPSMRARLPLPEEMGRESDVEERSEREDEASGTDGEGETRRIS